MASEHFQSGASFRFSPEQSAKLSQQKTDPSKRDTMNGFPSLLTASSNDFRSDFIRKQKAKAKAAAALMKKNKKKKKKKKKKLTPTEMTSLSKPIGATTPADGQYTFMESSDFRFSPDQIAKMAEQENDPCKR